VGIPVRGTKDHWCVQIRRPQSSSPQKRSEENDGSPSLVSSFNPARVNQWKSKPSRKENLVSSSRCSRIGGFSLFLAGRRVQGLLKIRCK
jgi:hypothetical protein